MALIKNANLLVLIMVVEGATEYCRYVLKPRVREMLENSQLPIQYASSCIGGKRRI